MIDNILGQESLGQESNNLPSIKQQTQEVICRVFFLRHGQSEDEAKNPSLPQDPETPLSPLGIEQIKTAAGRFQELGLNNKNTIIVYAEGTQRIRSSKEILQQYHNIATFKENRLLETTLKKYNPETNEVEDDKSHMQGVADQFKNIVDLVDGEILKSFQDKDGKYHGKKNIILLGHKSSEAFSQLANERTESTILHGLRIKPGETFEMDIDSTNKLINYEQHKEILHLTSENYKGILEILKQEEEISGYMDQLWNYTIQLFELQNIINAFFKKSPELYEKYLGSENVDLRVFCLTNLLVQNQNFAIERIYGDQNYNFPLVQAEKILLISNREEVGMRTILYKLYITKNHLRELEEGTIFDEYHALDFYKDLKKGRETYEKVIRVQNRSLDLLVHDGGSQGILKRKMKLNDQQKQQYEIARGLKESELMKLGRTPEETKRLLTEFDNNYEINLLTKGLCSGIHYVYPAHAGEGKSIRITGIVKNMLEKGNKIYFFEGKEINNVEDIKKIKSLDGADTIIVIDAIDEVPEKTIRDQLKEGIQTIKCGVVVTSRFSEFNNSRDINPGYRTIHLQDINSDIYIDARIHDQSKIGLIKTRKKRLGTKTTPLILFFLCELVNNYDASYQKLGIKALEEIYTLYELYENIMKCILTKYYHTKGNDIIARYLEIDLKILGRVAYNLQCGYYDDFEESDFKKFAVLNYNEFEGRYGFVHKSFEDFFLLRYILTENFCRYDRLTVDFLIKGIEYLDAKTIFGSDVFRNIIHNLNEEEEEEFLRAVCRLDSEKSLSYIKMIIELKKGGAVLFTLCSILAQKQSKCGDLKQINYMMDNHREDVKLFLCPLIHIFIVDDFSCHMDREKFDYFLQQHKIEGNENIFEIIPDYLYGSSIDPDILIDCFDTMVELEKMGNPGIREDCYKILFDIFFTIKRLQVNGEFGLDEISREFLHRFKGIMAKNINDAIYSKNCKLMDQIRRQNLEGLKIFVEEFKEYINPYRYTDDGGRSEEVSHNSVLEKLNYYPSDSIYSLAEETNNQEIIEYIQKSFPQEK